MMKFTEKLNLQCKNSPMAVLLLCNIQKKKKNQISFFYNFLSTAEIYSNRDLYVRDPHPNLSQNIDFDQVLYELVRFRVYVHMR